MSDIDSAIDILEHNWTKLTNPDYAETDLTKALIVAIKSLNEWSECIDDLVDYQDSFDYNNTEARKIVHKCIAIFAEHYSKIGV